MSFVKAVENHVAMWAFPDPGVKDVKFHNVVITTEELNKHVILTSLPSPLLENDLCLDSRNVFMDGCPPDKTVAKYMNCCHKSLQRLCSYLLKKLPVCSVSIILRWVPQKEIYLSKETSVSI